LNPAERLDQETIPTQAELRLYKKRQLKIAANDMVYGQIPNTDATERADSDRRELMGFVKELREMMRTDMARDEGRVLQTQDTIRDTADYERELREKLRAEIQEEMRAEMQEQIRASVHEQILALRQSFEAVPSPHPPVSTAVQTPQHANLPESPPALTSEQTRRSVRVKRAKQRL
jgi:hypothetical protein